jgi:hypothetical protein
MLATYEFSPNDEKTREQICNPELCKILVNKLSDPFVQIRFNSICAITNLIINYSENDIETLFIFEAGLFKKIEDTFSEYLATDLKVLTEGEIDKLNKFFKGIIDLLNLIVSEIYDGSYNKIDFTGIIRYILGFIMNPNSLSEEFILNCSIFICDISSQMVFPKELAKVFAPFAHKVVFEQGNAANRLIVSTFTCSLFYIYASYSEIENVKLIIELIYKSINFDLAKEVHDLNNLIQNYVQKISDDKMTDDGVHVDLKHMIRILEQSIRSNVYYLKTFNEIITNLENSINIENYEEEEIDVDDSTPNDLDDKINQVLTTIFNSDYETLVIMCNRDFISNIVNFFCNLSIEEFLMNDFDKMIVIKQLIFDLEYHTLSIVNNIIFNFDKIMSKI